MMWSRSLEIAVAVWLGISPFVFHQTVDHVFLLCIEFASAAVIAACSLGSFHRSWAKLHLLNLVVGTALILAGAFAGPAIPTPGQLQNLIVTGLLVLMLAIVPSRASSPPKAWRTFRAQTESASHI